MALALLAGTCVCPECLHLHAALVTATEESLAVHRDLRERIRSGEEVSIGRMAWAHKACVTVADILWYIKEHAITHLRVTRGFRQMSAE